MGIIWRYLIGHYLRIVSLCVLSFCGILLVTRLDDIARFAALGALWTKVFLFALYQIPYILPIAIPIACLIGAMILFSELSSSHELVALRAGGMSLFQLILPLVTVSILLCIGNFLIVSEIATRSHLMARSLQIELRTVNPLLLLHNKQLLEHQGFFVRVFGNFENAVFANDVAISYLNRGSHRLNLIVTKSMNIDKDKLCAHSTAIIGPSSEENGLLIENIASLKNAVGDVSALLQPSRTFRINDDYLSFRLLLVRAFELYSGGRETFVDFSRALSEGARRFCIALACVTFTLTGALFGMHFHRKRQRRNSFYVIALVMGFLFCFFFAKELSYSITLSWSLYFLPHAAILALCAKRFYRINSGLA